MRKQLGWGIVGPGKIADEKEAPAIVADPNSRLVAVVSRDLGRAEAFAKKYGGEKAYTDYAEMLRNPDVDAVLVTTPNAQHVDQVVAAARAGKHVLCDKPIALNTEDAKLELAECTQAGVVMGVNFHNRHLPWAHEARRMIAEGTIGTVVAIQAEASAGMRPARSWSPWRADPALVGLGVVNNVAVHIYDLLRFLIGAEFREAVALFDEQPAGEVEGLAMALLRFTTGAVAYVNANECVAKPQNDLTIYGTKGRIVARNLTRARFPGELEVATDAGEVVTPYPAPQSHQLCLMDFAEAVLNGSQPLASGLDGVRSVQLTDALARSVREKVLASVDVS